MAVFVIEDTVVAESEENSALYMCRLPWELNETREAGHNRDISPEIYIRLTILGGPCYPFPSTQYMTEE